MKKRAFVGTGLIGTGLAEAALGRGEAVVVWNRTASKTEPLGELGAERASSPAEATAGADFVHIALTSDDAVDSVLPAIEGALREGAVIIDHSTTSAERTAARQRALSERGVSFLDAPVFMSPAACKAATGVMVVCGAPTIYERAAEALAPMTGTVLFVGEQHGRAAALKLVGNGVILSLVGGLADVFAVGRPHGLAPADVLELFQTFDLRWVLGGRGAAMAAGNFDTSWSLRMARKDLGLMLSAAGEQPLAVLPGLAARADVLIDEGVGELDVGVLAKHEGMKL